MDRHTGTRKARLTVIIADDQVLFAQGLRRIIELSAPDLEVVGIARDGREAIALAEQLKPRVILMDVRMPGIDGVEATRVIKRLLPETQIIMLTTFSDEEYIDEALTNGATGYLLKDIRPEDLINTVRSLPSKSIMLSPSVAKKRFHSPHAIRDVDVRKMLGSLTPREKDVLDLILKNFGNRSIADTLRLTERTIRNYASIIYSKFSVENRFELLRVLSGLKE
jgi:DNA-binding NarL/FixJ family response regulator